MSSVGRPEEAGHGGAGDVNFTEHAVAFDCRDDTLIGVLALPATPAATAVVVVVGGPQYRAGSHRQFVRLSRVLAAQGHAVLRFDYRGMGDSEGEARDFEDIHEDIAAAIDLVSSRVPSAVRIVLWGLCDGASAALLYCDATDDERITALCLLNPWARTDHGLARTHIKHYYGQRLMQGDFWRKLSSGGVSLGALSGLLTSVRTALVGRDAPATASFTHRMARAWKQPGRPLLLVLSGDDYTAKEFLDHAATDAAWTGALDRPALQRHDLAQADHTFSTPEHTLEVERLTGQWLARVSGPLPSQALA